MKHRTLTILAGCTAAVLQSQAFGGALLGTAQQFAVLGASTVINTGPTIITGDLGVWPGTAVVGFPPGIVNGVMHINDAVAQQAQADALTAFTTLAGFASSQNLTGQDLGGMTLTAGTYTFSSSAQLTGTLTLDAQGDPNAVFVFQMESTLTTASNSSVTIINSTSSTWGNIFWQVGSFATLGAETALLGSIIASESVTLNTNASIVDGRAIALNGAVTMDSNIIGITNMMTPVIPAPPAVMMGLVGCGAVGLTRRRKLEPSAS